MSRTQVIAYTVGQPQLQQEWGLDNQDAWKMEERSISGVYQDAKAPACLCVEETGGIRLLQEPLSDEV